MDGEGEGRKKMRRSRIGMRGLRDMQRDLRRNHTEPVIRRDSVFYATS
jgi:hypothetical protein